LEFNGRAAYVETNPYKPWNMESLILPPL
jgi:hypothetical protein